MNANNNGVLGDSIDIKVEPCNTAAEIRADVKAITGPEMVIDTAGGNCDACSGNSSYNPCEMPQQVNVPYTPCDPQCNYPQPNPCGCNQSPAPHVPCNAPMPCSTCNSNAYPQSQPQPACNNHSYQQPTPGYEDAKPSYPKNNYATYTR